MWDWIAALVLCIFWSLTFARVRLKLPTVRDLPAGLALPEQAPLVSVIVAAKEEQDSIQETIRHLYHQTYRRMEIIAINDRSNDSTGARLDELKAWSDGKPSDGPAMRVIHITHLPAGWLGKNHAAYQGYLQSKGSYLLFTDADVRFEPNTIRDAVAYALQHHADHVTLLPKLEAKTFWLRAFVRYFLFGICMLIPPWIGNNDNQKRLGMGVGAFNLIRRDAYEGIGTHRKLSMRPDDDLRLGMLVKQAGFRQRVLSGAKRLSVEWYPTLKEAVRGLEKNLYAGFGYRLWKVSLGMLGQLAFYAFPLTAPLWSRGPALGLFLVADLFLIGTYLLHVRRLSNENGIEAAALPATVFLLVAVFIRSVALAHYRKGVYWRGTFYSLEEMKKLFSG